MSISGNMYSDIDAAKVENEFVHNVYEDISDHFSLTRHSPWPNVLKFVQSFPTASILIDVGCGNGKYFGHNRNIYEIGGDSSKKLAIICKNRSFEVTLFNCLNLPFADNIADGVICIAVLHHLATEARRLKAIQEIVRILKVDGKALIYTWARDQKNSRYLKKSFRSEDDTDSKEGNLDNENKNTLKISANMSLPVHLNGTKFDHNDLLVPWKLNCGPRTTYLRYYHVFQEKELEELCRIAGGTIVSSYYEEGNWCVILTRK